MAEAGTDLRAKKKATQTWEHLARSCALLPAEVQRGVTSADQLAKFRVAVGRDEGSDKELIIQEIGNIFASIRVLQSVAPFRRGRDTEADIRWGAVSSCISECIWDNSELPSEFPTREVYNVEDVDKVVWRAGAWRTHREFRAQQGECNLYFGTRETAAGTTNPVPSGIQRTRRRLVARGEGPAPGTP